MADEYESAGDYIVNILKFKLRMENAELKFSEKGKEEIRRLHSEVEDYMNMVTKAYEERYFDIITKAHSQGDAITHTVREIRNSHLNRVSTEKIEPLSSVLFIDTINAYRKVKDHILNMAEAMAGEK